MIDCRAFKLKPNPFPVDSMAHWFFGSPRDQWRWWWQEERMLSRPELRIKRGPVQGDHGVFQGIVFIDD